MQRDQPAGGRHRMPVLRHFRPDGTPLHARRRRIRHHGGVAVDALWTFERTASLATRVLGTDLDDRASRRTSSTARSPRSRTLGTPGITAGTGERRG